MSQDDIIIEKEQEFATPEMIESGLYYEEALKWYNSQFIEPAINKLYYSFFAIVYLFCMVFATNFIMNLFPLKEQKNIMVFTQKSIDSKIKATHLKNFSDPATNILFYSIENYVKNRESITLQNSQNAISSLQNKKRFIKNSSSAEVYKEYIESTSEFNVDVENFLTKNIPTTVSIEKTVFNRERQTKIDKIYSLFVAVAPPRSADVVFTRVNSSGVLERYLAKMDYTFYLTDSKNSATPVDFKVINYSVKKIR